MNKPITIVVASGNPVKIEAARRAFSAEFPGAQLELTALEVDSGVGEQPQGDEDTRRGAHNRVDAARRIHPGADYYVGLEGGVDRIGDRLIAFAWMVVKSNDGKTGEARSVTLPLPPAVQKLVDGGLELGDANDKVFATVNSKEAGGAFGLLTHGRYTREFIYSQTLSFALIPLVNDLYMQREMR